MNSHISATDKSAALNTSVVDLWKRLGLPGDPSGGRNVLSPWRKDGSPSVQVGGKKNIVFDHGTDESFDSIALVQKAKNCDFVSAIEFILDKRISGASGACGGNHKAVRARNSGNGKWTAAQAKGYLNSGRAHLCESKSAMDLLRSYGLTDETITLLPLALLKDSRGDAILYADFIDNPHAVKAKNVHRGKGGKRASFFRMGKPILWWPFAKPVEGAHIVIVGGEEKAMLIGQEIGGVTPVSTLAGEGAEKLTEAMAKEIAALKPARVTVALDADDSGQNSAPVWAGRLADAGVTDVRIVVWPDGLKPGFDVNDAFLNASGGDAGRVALQRLMDGASAFAPIMAGSTNACSKDDKKLPAICASSGDLPKMTAAAWNAIIKANCPPFLFLFGNSPSRIEREGADRLIVRMLSEDRLRHHVARCAYWYKDTKAGREDAFPPTAMIKDMLATPEPPLPVLDRIVEAPVFAADGRLIDLPGHDAAARIYYEPSLGLKVPPVSLEPTHEECKRAWLLIHDELLGDFPFIEECERTHAVGMMLLPFIRQLVDSPTPLHLIEKPSPGTGASLLADCAGRIATGQPPAALPEGGDEEEWRKRMTATLRTSPTIILIDNLRRQLDSAAVSIALTARIWEDRILGLSETIRLPVQCMWIATGNNPALSSEISRRTIRIRLDARIDRPWLREPSAFRHANLHDWVAEHRGELIWAFLTMARAWLAAGRPMGNKTLGMYESWACIVGGILEVNGFPDFLGNLSEFYDASDQEGESHRAFVAKWWERFDDDPTTTAVLFPVACEAGLDLGKGADRSQQTRLGKIVSNLRDRTFSIDGKNLTVRHAGVSHNAATWMLTP